MVIGKAEDGLNKNGRVQATAVGEYMKRVPLDVIYTSPQKRAIETAEIISNRVNVTVEVRTELLERDYGPYDGTTREQLIALRKDRGLDTDDPTQDWHGVDEVESDRAVWNRVRSLLEVSDSHNVVLMVTHAGVVKSVLHSIFEIPHDRHNCFKIRNGTMIILRKVEGKLELTGLIPAVILAQYVRELK